MQRFPAAADYCAYHVSQLCVDVQLDSRLCWKACDFLGKSACVNWCFIPDGFIRKVRFVRVSLIPLLYSRWGAVPWAMLSTGFIFVSEGPLFKHWYTIYSFTVFILLLWLSILCSLLFKLIHKLIQVHALEGEPPSGHFRATLNRIGAIWGRPDPSWSLHEASLVHLGAILSTVHGTDGSLACPMSGGRMASWSSWS